MKQSYIFGIHIWDIEPDFLEEVKEEDKLQTLINKVAELRIKEGENRPMPTIILTLNDLINGINQEKIDTEHYWFYTAESEIDPSFLVKKQIKLMTKKEPSSPITLREWIHDGNIEERDEDVYIDCAEYEAALVCGDIRLTELGEKRYGKMLDTLLIDNNNVITSPNTKDYDKYMEWEDEETGDGGPLRLAEEFIMANAGYALSEIEHKLYFENGTLI